MRMFHAHALIATIRSKRYHLVDLEKVSILQSLFSAIKIITLSSRVLFSFNKVFQKLLYTFRNVQKSSRGELAGVKFLLTICWCR